MRNIFSFEKDSSFEKLIRVTSFVLRFIDNNKVQVKHETLVVGKLTLEKVYLAKYLLIKNEQF